MKHFLVLALSFVWIDSLPAQGPTLKEARQRLLKGNHAEAEELYTELAKIAQHRGAAALGLSRALQSQGEYDRALAGVEAALKEFPKNADLLARRAEILYLRGRWDEAHKDASHAVGLNENHFLARWVRAQVLRDRGEIKKADEELRWFIRTYTNRSNMDMDITDPDELLVVGLAGCERARWHNLSDQFEFILNEVWTDAIKRDPDFWPAEYESGRLLHEKSNKAGSYRSFDKALAINPRAAEVLVAKGAYAFQRFEIKDADLLVQRALKINPRLPEAHRLAADIYMFAGNVEETLKSLSLARTINPRDEATLARLAACYHLQGKDKEAAAIVKEVEAHNVKPAVFCYELAAQLEARRLYDVAEENYRKAIKLQPQLPYAQNGLGLMYMRRGKEDEAKETLEVAFKADPFNVRVGNTLKVLDHLAKYTTLKTEHFHLRYDPANDEVLANFMARYLEEIYAELAAKFNYRPKGPILIEVFNKHEMFSGRVLSLPDLHTIGACTGDVIAMVSPRDKSGIVSKPFNWVRVLRHELVHIFNLDQTRYRVPHWFTEGLAVMLEGTPPPPSWNQMLAEKLQADELLNLDNILLGFIRPRSPDEWHQAYMQSLLYVEYLVKQHTDKAIGGMLDAYREGLDTAAALEKACKVSKADFEKGYRAFLDQRVKEAGVLTAQRGMTFKELKDHHAKDPKDIDIAARLAERYFLVGEKEEADRLVRDVLVARKDHALAGYVKARLHIDADEKDKALALLETAAAANPPEVKAIALQAKLHFERKNFKDAAQALERGRKLQRHEPAWLVQLARVYVHINETAKLIDVLKDLVPADADDIVTRRKLAQLLEDRPAEAEKYARMALEIDVLDTEAARILESALRAQNKDQELQQLRKMLKR